MPPQSSARDRPRSRRPRPRSALSRRCSPTRSGAPRRVWPSPRSPGARWPRDALATRLQSPAPAAEVGRLGRRTAGCRGRFTDLERDRDPGVDGIGATRQGAAVRAPGASRFVRRRWHPAAPRCLGRDLELQELLRRHAAPGQEPVHAAAAARRLDRDRRHRPRTGRGTQPRDGLASVLPDPAGRARRARHRSRSRSSTAGSCCRPPMSTAPTASTRSTGRAPRTRPSVRCC